MIDRQIRNSAMKLKDFEKIKLIEELSESLEPVDIEVEKKWAKESDRRFNLFKEGKTKAISLDKALKKYSI